MKGANEFFRKEPDDEKYIRDLSDFAYEVIKYYKDKWRGPFIHDVDTLMESLGYKEAKIPTRKLINKVLANK